MTVAVKMTERQLRDAVVACARLLGYDCYWTWSSKHSPAGMPDLLLTKDGRLIFAELKVGVRKTTPEQDHWLAVLEKVPSAEVFLWRDHDWLSGRIERVLRETRDA